jgi:hypothetical protein
MNRLPEKHTAGFFVGWRTINAPSTVVAEVTMTAKDSLSLRKYSR